MRTIVLQSFRTEDVPDWLTACMDSVLAWAMGNGSEYRRRDDVFFDLAPDWVRARCGENIYPVTDICRLLWMREQLHADYDRVVWADADLLVFAPGRLNLATKGGHGFAHELFLGTQPSGEYVRTEGLNNSLMVFEHAGLAVLERYLEACLDALRAAAPGPIPREALLPLNVPHWPDRRALGKVYGVGLFGLSLMTEIAAGGGALTREYARRVPRPLAAANLSHFLRNAAIPEARPHFDSVYKIAVGRLLATRGAAVA
jgi:hypothetical protein